MARKRGLIEAREKVDKNRMRNEQLGWYRGNIEDKARERSREKVRAQVQLKSMGTGTFTSK